MTNSKDSPNKENGDFENSTTWGIIFLRLYYIKDGVETSVWFAFPDSSAVELYSFITEKPSDYSLQAIEESEVLFLSRDKLNKLYESHPKANEMMRNFWEDVILNLINRFTSL